MKKELAPETNLQGLIKRIKDEGIDEAKKKADEIVLFGENKASEIIVNARKEAELILKKANEEKIKNEKTGKKELEYAARDLIIYVKQSLVDIFDSIVKEECKKALSGKGLERILLHVIDGWTQDKDKKIDLEVLLSRKDRDALLESFLSKVKEKTKGGIEVRGHPRVETGFRIGLQGENVHYDFTDEVVADILAAYMNARFAGIFGSVQRKQDPKKEKQKEG